MVQQPPCTPDQVVRTEHMIPSEPGVELFVIRIAAPHPRKGAVVVMHGAGSPGSASFDLKGASLMRELACAGFDVHTLDVRGFGRSTIPPAMNAPPEKNEPLVRAAEAARDLAAAARFAIATSSVARVDVIGWSWGAEVAGMFAGTSPELVDRLILLAPVYDRRWPARHIASGAWREEKRADVEKFFSAEREERSVWEDYLNAQYRERDVVRLPNGPYRDLYGEDAPVWDASKILAPVLIVRGELDAASKNEHALKLYADLKNAADRRYVVLGGLAHFLFRERRRTDAYEVIIDYLNRGS